MNAILDSILQADTEIFLYLNNLGTEQWDQFWLWVTNKKSWIPLYFIFLVISYFHLRKRKSMLALAFCVILLITFVDQSTSSFFKPKVGRLRPCYFEMLDGLVRLVKDSCGGKYTFFSGHSSNSFAIATFLGFLLKDWSRWFFVFLIFWAGMVAYSRVYIGVHFPLDIFVGAVWGSLFGWFAYLLFEKLQSNSTT